MTKIVAFEGIDGTGKSVQLENLRARLVGRGLTVATISFPIYTSFFGGEVGRLLSGQDAVRADMVPGKSMALWFALDRFEAFQAFDYTGADVLLINRYVLSNAVYQSIRDCDLDKPDLLDFVQALEYDHFHIPRPDVHLVLDMSVDDAADNVSRKGFRDYVGDQKDVYESLPTLQERARIKYRTYAGRLPNVILIPCMDGRRLKSIDDIGRLIDRALDGILLGGSSDT